MDGEQITLEQAIGLLSLPRTIGLHPERGEPIEAGIGRFGPYVRMGGVYASLDRDDDVLSVGINRAVDVLAKKLAGVRTVGAHPKDGEPVVVKRGRFGPYLQHGSLVANLPRNLAMEDVTLEEAVALLAEKGKPLKPKAGAKGRKNGRTTRTKAGDAETSAAAAPQPARKSTSKTAAPKKKAAAPARKAAAKKPGANKVKRPAARKAG
jgi:DNA topoisomerase-1